MGDIDELFDALTAAWNPPAWHAEAACRGDGTDRWFPTVGANHHRLRELRRICAACPVSGECLEEGLNHDHGVWGGRSGRELRQMRQRSERFRPCRLCGANVPPGRITLCSDECAAVAQREPRDRKRRPPEAPSWAWWGQQRRRIDWGAPPADPVSVHDARRARAAEWSDVDGDLTVH